MVKAGMIALFGLLALTPVARASETPAFVNATMCDAAGPISSGVAIFSRQIRAERRVGKVAEARPQRRTPAARRAPATPAPRTQAPAAQAEVPADEAVVALRPAVHFCMTPEGAANPVRYT